MKKSRFTDSQIAEALRRVEAGLLVPEFLPGARHQLSDLLQVAGELRRDGHIHDGQTQGAGAESSDQAP
jgi:hypothetical protein